MLNFKKINRFLICGVLIGSLMLSGIYFPRISFSPAFLVLLIILNVITIFNILYKEKISIKDSFKRIVFAEVGLIVSVYLAYCINGVLFCDRFVLIVTSIIFQYACYIDINDIKDIEFYFKLYVFISFISAIVEIGQFFGIQLFYSLWHIVQEGDALEHFASAERYFGLSSNLVNFGYQMSVAFTITLFLPFKRHKIIRIVLLCIYAFSIWTSQTRSSLVWIASVFVYYLLFWEHGNRTWKRAFLSILIIAATIYLVIFGDVGKNFTDARIFSANYTTGTLARIPMLLTAFNHAIHYPLGMGIYSVNSNLIIGTHNYLVYQTVLSNTAHNIIGNCVAGYGFISLVFLIMVYIETIKPYFCSQKFQDETVKRCIKISVMCVLALLFNSMFHNKSILNGEFSSWLFIAISLSVYKFQNATTNMKIQAKNINK